jgi:hypothetical protein
MGTGGSRFGAGRPATHVKAENCLRLDVRRWHRKGMLWAGSAGTWAWTNTETGERRGSIGYRVESGAVRLDYSTDNKPSGQTVELTYTRCNYGGARPWFVCPIRFERVAVLYLRAGRFACRHCQRLTYASQSGDSIDRTWRKQYKAEEKLGENWQRPKGMHRRTHERLMSVIWDCEQRRDEALSLHLAALTRRYPSLSRDPRLR